MRYQYLYHIVRVGTAITFLWIGALILKDPEGWGGLMQSWAINILPVSLKEIMLGTAVLDIFIGFLLLVDYFSWVAAALAALHLMVVLTVTGINIITVRDIGILASVAAIFFAAFPKGRKVN